MTILGLSNYIRHTLLCASQKLRTDWLEMAAFATCSALAFKRIGSRQKTYFLTGKFWKVFFFYNKTHRGFSMLIYSITEGKDLLSDFSHFLLKSKWERLDRMLKLKISLRASLQLIHLLSYWFFFPIFCWYCVIIIVFRCICCCYCVL